MPLIPIVFPTQNERVLGFLLALDIWNNGLGRHVLGATIGTILSAFRTVIQALPAITKRN